MSKMMSKMKKLLPKKINKITIYLMILFIITLGGITPLLQTLRELEDRGIKGEILTTNYLTFTEPKALKKLNDFSNITLKMYNVDVTIEDFHTKGYIFKKEEIYYHEDFNKRQICHETDAGSGIEQHRSADQFKRRCKTAGDF